jgi:hypothetical protein
MGDFTILAKCGNGHSQEVVLHNFTEQAAREYAALLDGTHPMYIYSPREEQSTPTAIAHCNTCGALVDCRVIGPDGKQV